MTEPIAPAFPFTAEEDAIILVLGSDARAVADQLFVPIAAVRERLKQLTTPPRRDRRVTPEEILYAAKARRKGRPWKLIGYDLDRDGSSIRRAYERDKAERSRRKRKEPAALSRRDGL